MIQAASRAVLFTGLMLGAAACGSRPAPPPESQTDAPVERRVESVAALGQLEPEGDVRRLAAPNAGVAGSPRIAALLVDEGDSVVRGQVLARFDNRPGLLADRAEVDAEVTSLNQEITLQELEISRYSQAAERGAAALVLLEEKHDELIRLRGRRDRALARRGGIQVDIDNSELVAPLDGLVLEVHAREGERPGAEGVLDLGASQRMQARIEVYESDIARIQLAQPVLLSSENGGFDGQLKGRVTRISPQVQQRDVLSTDPTGDADARVVEVMVALDDADAQRVIRLAGLKVIARFEP